MPSPGKKITCPNCGRKKVKLKNKKPAVYSSVSAVEAKEAVSGTFFSSLGLAIMITIISLVLIAMGIASRTPFGYLCSALGIVGAFVAAYCYRYWSRNFTVDRKPEKGYIDFLNDIQESRGVLQEKIEQLEYLKKRQRPRESERAANRTKLLKAALNNRTLKLQLLDEAEFIIEAKKRISRIEALAQDLTRKKSNHTDIEKRVEKAFIEIKKWMANLNIDCQSVAGMKVYHSLEQAMGLHSDIMEQIEDRLVMQAIDGNTETDEIFALEHIQEFLEKSSLQEGLEAFEINEAAAADEEFIKINTELRLLKDGIKDGVDYQSGLS